MPISPPGVFLPIFRGVFFFSGVFFFWRFFFPGVKIKFVHNSSSIHWSDLVLHIPSGVIIVGGNFHPPRVLIFGVCAGGTVN